jgi:hypothetical protein
MSAAPMLIASKFIFTAIKQAQALMRDWFRQGLHGRPMKQNMMSLLT